MDKEKATEKSGISRREFLKRSAWLAAGAVVGYEGMNQLGLPSKILSEILENEEIQPYLVEERLRKPVNVGAFGADERVPGMEQALITPIHRRLDFMHWYGNHKGDQVDYINRKLNFLRKQIHQGRVPGLSMRPGNTDGGTKFEYGSRRYYDEVHRPFLEHLADQIRELKVPVELSFYEPNIKPEPPGEYADLFRYVVEVFRSRGALNVIHTMYLSAQFPLTLGMVNDYYPGHEYIDKFGFSIYDLYRNYPWHFHHWLPGNMSAWQTAWPWLKAGLKVTDGKVPLVIAETGTGRDWNGEAADWMVELFVLCHVLGIEEINYFNVDFGHKYSGSIPEVASKLVRRELRSFEELNLGERDWSIDERRPERQEAFRQRFEQLDGVTDKRVTLESIIRVLAEYVQRNEVLEDWVIEVARKIDADNKDRLLEQERRIGGR